MTATAAIALSPTRPRPRAKRRPAAAPPPRHPSLYDACLLVCTLAREALASSRGGAPPDLCVLDAAQYLLRGAIIDLSDAHPLSDAFAELGEEVGNAETSVVFAAAELVVAKTDAERAARSKALHTKLRRLVRLDAAKDRAWRAIREATGTARPRGEAPIPCVVSQILDGSREVRRG